MPADRSRCAAGEPTVWMDGMEPDLHCPAWIMDAIDLITEAVNRQSKNENRE